jgi:hypothetical protein
LNVPITTGSFVHSKFVPTLSKPTNFPTQNFLSYFYSAKWNNKNMFDEKLCFVISYIFLFCVFPNTFHLKNFTLVCGIRRKYVRDFFPPISGKFMLDNKGNQVGGFNDDGRFFHLKKKKISPNVLYKIILQTVRKPFQFW